MLHCKHGRFEQGLALLEQARALSSDAPDSLAALAWGLASAERSEEAQGLLGQLQQRAETGFVSPLSFALVHVALGQNDEAFDWLERAYQMRFAVLPLFAAAWPPLEPLRSDSRFADLIERIRGDAV
jgi:tetratricopeptide (TPR) repeat protein